MVPTAAVLPPPTSLALNLPDALIQDLSEELPNMMAAPPMAALPTPSAVKPFTAPLHSLAALTPIVTSHPVAHQAWQQVQTLGFPRPQQEAWKYERLTALKSASLVMAEPQSDNDAQAGYTAWLSQQDGAIQTAYQNALVIANGQLHASKTPLDGMTLEALSWDSVPKAVAEQWLEETTKDALASTTLAVAPVVYHLSITAPITQPLAVVVWDQAITPWAVSAVPLWIEVAPNASAHVLSHWVNASSENPTLTTASVFATLDTDAALSLAWHQHSSHAETAVMVHAAATQQHGSQLSVTHTVSGEGLHRGLMASTLSQPAASLSVKSFHGLTESQNAHWHTKMIHAAADCHSEQRHKGVLLGNSRSDFDGTIVVKPHAQQTDAAQLSNTLLLSDNALAYTRPQLQIDADDVKCSHGATVGQLDPAHLFYLQSRGINLPQAKMALIDGFMADILETIPSPEHRSATAAYCAPALQEV